MGACSTGALAGGGFVAQHAGRCITPARRRQGGKKCQEANYIIRELIERHGPTVLLLNCLAVTDMQLGNYADAERSLLDALSKVRAALTARGGCALMGARLRGCRTRASRRRW